MELELVWGRGENCLGRGEGGRTGWGVAAGIGGRGGGGCCCAAWVKMHCEGEGSWLKLVVAGAEVAEPIEEVVQVVGSLQTLSICAGPCVSVVLY